MARSRSTFGRVFRRAGRDGYYVRVRLHGQEVTRWAGPDRKMANELLADLLRKSAREDLLGERAVAPVSFAEFKPALLAYMEARHEGTTLRGERGRVDRIVAYFGTRAIRDLSAGDVSDFLTALKCDGLSVATVNRYASCLSVAFRLAVEKDYARSNPVLGMPRPKEPRHAVAFVSDADIARLLASHTDAAFRSFLRVLSDTGLRRSEAVALEWRDVDLRRGVLLVRQSKSKEPREVPLTQAARAALQELMVERPALPLKGKSPVWPEYQGQSNGALSRRFDRLATRAGFDGLRLHDLRHSCASRLAQAGVALPTIAALLGHRVIATTMRYAQHLPAGATQEAIRRLDRAPATQIPHAEGDQAGDQSSGGAATG